MRIGLLGSEHPHRHSLSPMHALRLLSDSIEPSHGESAFAAIGHANLARSPANTPAVPSGVPRGITWSGRLGEGDEPFRALPDAGNWTRAGWVTLIAACESLLPELRRRGVDLCLRPHARHILSDAQGCLTLLRGNPDVRLLLDPGSMLAGSMLPRIEDHLTRIFEALGEHPAVAAVVLANVRLLDPKDEDALILCPLHRGLIDPELLLRTWQAHCPPQLPCVLLEEEFEAQAAMLGQG